MKKELFINKKYELIKTLIPCYFLKNTQLAPKCLINWKKLNIYIYYIKTKKDVK